MDTKTIDVDVATKTDEKVYLVINKKNIWSIIATIVTIIVALIALFGYIHTVNNDSKILYGDIRSTQGVIEYRLNENEKLSTETDNKIIKIYTKIDSTVSDNKTKQDQINKNIEELAKNIKNLTYVIKKNNIKMNKDLKYIKEIQSQNYVFK